MGIKFKNWIVAGWCQVKPNIKGSKSDQAGDWYEVCTEWRRLLPGPPDNMGSLLVKIHWKRRNEVEKLVHIVFCEGYSIDKTRLSSVNLKYVI